METKICTQCKKELPIEDFNWRDKKKGTRRSECKYCHCKYMRDVYAEKQDLIAKIKTQKKCKKCGEEKDYMLDFHHLDSSQKEKTVARMLSNNYNIERTLDEIEKCVVLCSNHHREFHYLNDNFGIVLEDYLDNNYSLV